MTKSDMELIRSLSASREFEALKRLAEDMSVEWLRNAGGGQTEWDYVKTSLMRDGKVEGIRELIAKVCESNR